MRQLLISCITALFALLAAGPALAERYTLAIHPVLPKSKTVATFQPLADYLNKATGHTFSLQTTANFLVHWQMMKRERFDLVLDGPHFTDYRVRKMDYEVVAKQPAVVSYTLIGDPDLFILEPADLIGKTIATTPSPALGALRLAQLFANPLRQPNIVEAEDSEAAAQKALAGETAAAMIPAPMVGRYPGLVTIQTTEQVPAPALSASPRVAPEHREAIRDALRRADRTPAGRRVLEALNISHFEAAENSDYAGYAVLLEGVWGY